jgi:hypothetical protein
VKKRISGDFIEFFLIQLALSSDQRAESERR